MSSPPPLAVIVVFKLFTVTMMGLVMHATFADSSPAEDQRAHQLPPPPPPPFSAASKSSFFNFSSTPIPTTALLQGKNTEVGPPGSFAIPLRLVKQPSGWGMVGEILAGHDYDGLSYRVMFDPQTSSTFLFDHSMKKFKNSEKMKIFTAKNHLYEARLSITSDPVPGDELNDNLFDISHQDKSRYQGKMISESMEFDKLIMKNVHFGTVTYMNDAAANIRGGTFDGIVGLGFGGFTQGGSATCILSRMMMHPKEGLGAMGLERGVFSLYISPTGKSGEIRFGGTNPTLLMRGHTFKYHNVDLRPKATRPDDEESNDSNKSHHRRAGSVTTMDSFDEVADDRLIGIDSSDDTSFDPLDGVESSDDEETRRGGSSRTSSGDGDSTQYHDAHQEERSMMGEKEDDENSRPFSDVSAPSPTTKAKIMPERDWMWGFNGLVVTIGDSVVSISTKNDKQKVGMAFSTLVPYGLVVNTRNDYVSSTFHHALRSSEAELLSVGDGHHVEEAEILIRCEERASLPPLSFKFGNKNDKNDVFAVFDGEEYFPTVLTKDDMLKLLEVNKEGRKAGMKVKKAKWWKQWIKKMTKGGEKEKLEKAKKGEQWCSTRDFIQFRQTGDDEEEIWQLGLGFMKKYVVEYDVASGERRHRIGIALSKGEEIKLPNKRLKKIQARYNFRKKKMEYK